MKKIQILVCLLVLSISCKKSKPTESELPMLNIDKVIFQDKIKGLLVGSALGDAMGAPTEMWSREAIRLEYGHVVDLDSMVREQSPEGTWKTNLPAGGTTDDTRWKDLGIRYLLSQKTLELSPTDFCHTILDQQNADIENFKKINSKEAEPFEENSLKVAWLQEWAKVSRAYLSGSVSIYADALSLFYGGEMVCGGQLYSPILASFYPGNPSKAYSESYKLSLFDIGYARDITASVAAMTASALAANVPTTQLKAALKTDPKDYFKSRLVGRSAYRIFRQALYIADLAKKSKSPIETAYAHLDQAQQDMPFHAGEIYLQVLTAIFYSDFDYSACMEFLINYGRDNDTTAAIAGAILGAYHGYAKLPVDKHRVIKTTSEHLDINLDKLSDNLSKHVINLYKK
jgi:ADP-ribosylglycohydrolase